MTLAAALVAAALVQDGPAVDLSKYDAACGVKVERKGAALEAAWSAGDAGPRSVAFNLSPGAPLFASLAAGNAVLARDVRPVYLVTTGSRTERAGERYIFFDKPASRPTKTHTAALDLA